MLQEFWSDGSHEGRPAGKLGLGVSICFMCADALAIYRDARARGLDPGEPFVGNGLWVTSFADPDGYRLDFESPTDVPEDTKLGEWVRGRRDFGTGGTVRLATAAPDHVLDEVLGIAGATA